MTHISYTDLVISGTSAESMLLIAGALQSGATIYLHNVEAATLAQFQEQLHELQQPTPITGENPPGGAPDIQARLRVGLPEESVVRFEMSATAESEKRAAVADGLQELTANGVLVVLLEPAQSLTKLTSGMDGLERIVGVRLTGMDSPPPLAEVISQPRTDQYAVTRAAESLRMLGWPVAMAADTPGLVVDRLLSVLQMEAVRCMAEGVPAEQIDQIMRISQAAAEGPFESMERIGMQRALAIAESLFAANYQEPRLRPHPLQARIAAAGSARPGSADEEDGDGAR